MNCFLKAIEKGNINASTNIGLLYYDGLGVEQNYTEALKWFQKAAENNNYQGQGLKKDKKMAQEWRY